MDYVCAAVRFAMDQLRVSTLKDKQKDRGYSQLCSRPCTSVRSCIVVCVSPLVSLMMDQVSKYSSNSLTTQFLGEAEEDYSVIVECWNVNIS